MSDLPITDSMASALAKFQLPHLTCLNLDKTDLTAAAMSQLASANWPALSSLMLRHSQLNPGTMHHLMRIRMPVLETLHITHAGIEVLGVNWLAQGARPLLKNLNLSYNSLDAKAIQHLAKGIWPSLMYLSLVGNPFGHRGVRDSTKGNWPVLNYLDLDLQMLDENSAVVLGLDPNEVAELKCTALPHCIQFLDLELCRKLVAVVGQAWARFWYHSNAMSIVSPCKFSSLARDTSISLIGLSKAGHGGQLLSQLPFCIRVCHLIGNAAC